MDSAFTFCGIYLRQTEVIRLADWPLATKDVGLTAEECQEEKELRRELSVRVRAKIEDLVGNDRPELAVDTAASPMLKRDLDYYLEYGAREEAVRCFFSGDTPDGQFRSNYQAKEGQQGNLLAYLTAPESFVEAEARRYIREHQMEILMEFLKNDALRAEYDLLEADAASPLHRMRDVTLAVKGSGAKTVNVTVRKGNDALTFKMPARGMVGYHRSYNAWDIPAQDRKKFYELFGSHADFTADEITQITYGRNTIYEAPSTPVEDLEQDAGPSMTMGGM